MCFGGFQILVFNYFSTLRLSSISPNMIHLVDSSICLDGETCAGHCAVGAVTQHNWAETYGVGQNGTGVDVGFVTQLVLLWTVRSGLEVGEWQGQQ